MILGQWEESDDEIGAAMEHTIEEALARAEFNELVAKANNAIASATYIPVDYLQRITYRHESSQEKGKLP